MQESTMKQIWKSKIEFTEMKLLTSHRQTANFTWAATESQRQIRIN